MSSASDDRRSVLHETIAHFYRDAEEALAAAEASAEVELRAQIAALKADGRFSPLYLDDYAHQLAIELSDAATNRFLRLMELVIEPGDDVSAPTGSDAPDDDLIRKRAEYRDHLDHHLRKFIAKNEASMTARDAPAGTPRLRRSVLAGED